MKNLIGLGIVSNFSQDPGGGLEIRVASRNDHGAYNRLIMEVDTLHAREAPRYFQVPEPPGRAEDYFASFINDPGQIVFLAVEEGQALGQIHLELQHPGDLPILVKRVVVRVTDIVVAAGHRRQGIGHALMDQAKAWARAQGADELSLSVSAFNQGAARMYEAEGFRPIRSVMALPLDKAQAS
jgi:GNAT superfamily N-acetyltransferase